MSQQAGDSAGFFSASTGLTPGSTPAQPEVVAAPSPVAAAQPVRPAAAPAWEGPSTGEKVARAIGVGVSTVWGVILIVLAVALFASPVPFWASLVVLLYGVYLVWPSRRGKLIVY